jgi:hypothetical protein
VGWAKRESHRLILYVKESTADDVWNQVVSKVDVQEHAYVHQQGLRWMRLADSSDRGTRKS